jgi:DNA-directed RNA polymerase alpha subunit
MDLRDLMDHDPERTEKIKGFARRFEVHLLRANYAGCRRLIDEAQFELETAPDKLGQRSLSQIGVSVRTCNVLDEKFGVVTIGDLVNVKTDRLLATENVGTKTIDEIWQKVLAAVLPPKE